MSPDQYKQHPFVKMMIKASSNLLEAIPEISYYLIHNPADFRGFTMFLGDQAEWVVGLRAYDGEGAPIVCWSSGDDPLLALLNLEKGLREHRFIKDKKAVERSLGHTAAHKS